MLKLASPGALQPSEPLATVARARLQIGTSLKLMKRSANVAKITQMDPVGSRCGETLMVRLKPLTPASLLALAKGL